jgi:hypothetical protein
VRFRTRRGFDAFGKNAWAKEGQARRACPLFLIAFSILIPRLIPQQIWARFGIHVFRILGFAGTITLFSANIYLEFR